MVVLVAGERQAEALDGVGDEHHRAVVVDRFEGLDEARQIMAAEVRHQPPELLVGALVDQPRHRTLVAEIVEEALAPCRAALEGQRRVELVRAAVDPGAEPVAAGLGEGLRHQRPVFEGHHLPAEGAEDRLEAVVEALADDGVEALPVVVDDPPRIAQTLLPPLEQRLEDIALVHLGVADEGDHPALRPVLRPAMRLDVVLDEAREEGLRDA